MQLYSDTWKNFINELVMTLQSASKRSQKALAWQQLNTIDEGLVKIVKPYTKQAIEILESAYAFNEEDCNVIHHLAIAHHAMAWDFELEGSQQAYSAWQKSLFYWDRLQNCEEFWSNLYLKVKEGDSEFDRTIIEAFRKDLFTNLFEIHVNFIKYYSELQIPDRAKQHIEIIKHAQIPPAARKTFEKLVYEAMISAVPKLDSEGRFKEALTLLDDFLNFFPFYVHALEKYLDISRRWLEQFSGSIHYNEIKNLEKMVLPKWEKLNQLGQSSSFFTLNIIAIAFGSKYSTRARVLRNHDEEYPLDCEEYNACGCAIKWFKKIQNDDSFNSEKCDNLYHLLKTRAIFLYNAAISSEDFDVKDVKKELLEKALSDCEEAKVYRADEKILSDLIEKIMGIKKWE